MEPGRAIVKVGPEEPQDPFGLREVVLEIRRPCIARICLEAAIEPQVGFSGASFTLFFFLASSTLNLCASGSSRFSAQESHTFLKLN